MSETPETEIVSSKSKLSIFREKHALELHFLGLLLLQLMRAEIFSGKREPSAMYVVVSRLAEEQGIDIGELFQELEVLDLPIPHDGSGGSIL